MKTFDRESKSEFGSAECAVAACLFLVAVASATAQPAAAGSFPAPPPLPKRAIAPSPTPPAGVTIELDDQGSKLALFVPQVWKPQGATGAVLSVHFHTTPWFVVQEHLRRTNPGPLLVVTLGEGSATYAKPYRDTNRFARQLELVATPLKQRGADKNFRITSVDLSSFSAGYGAVRELLKSPAYFQIIRRIVLLDSLYAGWEGDAATPATRKPQADQIEVWMPFVRAAVRGEKTFVLTHSAVPTLKYASTADCADAILARLGVARQPVPTGALPASNDPDFPLRSRADSGRFHVWGYDGTDAQAHLTHARHMADVWNVLDNSNPRAPDSGRD